MKTRKRIAWGWGAWLVLVTLLAVAGVIPFEAALAADVLAFITFAAMALSGSR